MQSPSGRTCPKMAMFFAVEIILSRIMAKTFFAENGMCRNIAKEFQGVVAEILEIEKWRNAYRSAYLGVPRKFHLVFCYILKRKFSRRFLYVAFACIGLDARLFYGT